MKLFYKDNTNQIEGMIVGLERFNLDNLPDLKVIGINMTSTEHLPWEEINRRGIKVISLANSVFLKFITSTAEHTMGLIIALLRNYKSALNSPYQDRMEYQGHTLSGKTLGIIGFGRVGRQLKKIAQGFGMKVITYEKHDPEKYLNMLLSISDIVSVHIPLAGNQDFFTDEMFNQMKPEAYFINTSRSGIVKDSALRRALENHIIKGAAVDFIDDSALLEYSKNHQNLILTNHLGGCTVEDMAATEEFIIKLVTNYLNEN